MLGQIVMSEPIRLGEFLPEVIENIRRRCEQNPDNKAFKPTASKHKQRVVSAVRDYMSQGRRQRRRQSNKAKSEKTLW